MAQATGNMRAICYRNSMLKRDKKRRTQGNTSRTTRTEGKVLMKVSAFFSTQKLIIIKDIDGILYSRITDPDSFEIVACFKLKIEHENLHRNNEKNNPLEPLPDQQLKWVVVKCSVYW